MGGGGSAPQRPTVTAPQRPTVMTNLMIILINSLLKLESDLVRGSEKLTKKSIFSDMGSSLSLFIARDPDFLYIFYGI